MPSKSILAGFLSGWKRAEIMADSEKCELLLRQARSASLLGRVARLCEVHDLSAQLPKRMQEHLQSATYVADANHRSVRWEVRQILSLLSEEGIPLCLLKGAAYVHGQVEAGKGRVFSDVDIMVPKEFLH